MRIKYEDWNPAPAALADVARARQICAEFAAQGYDLTLRQLYYQFVARGLIPNTQKSYKRLGDIVNRARLAGLLDWDYIVDRTRAVESVSHWDTPGAVIDAAARSYRLDKWETQPTRVEVWVEKEALAGVIERSARDLDVAWFSCRGYVSQSEMWGAAQRLGEYLAAGQRVVILHLGDHDPSGLDMTRDIRERLTTFLLNDWANGPHGLGGETFGEIREEIAEHLVEEHPELEGELPFEVRRIALNADQVEQYDPPPNPAKLSDSRAEGYVAEWGYESWELDALDPTVLDGLIRAEVDDLLDVDAYEELESREAEERRLLEASSRRWPELVEVLES